MCNVHRSMGASMWLIKMEVSQIFSIAVVVFELDQKQIPGRSPATLIECCMWLLISLAKGMCHHWTGMKFHSDRQAYSNRGFYMQYLHSVLAFEFIQIGIQSPMQTRLLSQIIVKSTKLIPSEVGKAVVVFSPKEVNSKDISNSKTSPCWLEKETSSMWLQWQPTQSNDLKVDFFFQLLVRSESNVCQASAPFNFGHLILFLPADLLVSACGFVLWESGSWCSHGGAARAKGLILAFPFEPLFSSAVFKLICVPLLSPAEVVQGCCLPFWLYFASLLVYTESP